ncbi:hypothetical protein GCM10028822_12470 [Hymenobacter terrigena]
MLSLLTSLLTAAALLQGPAVKPQSVAPPVAKPAPAPPIPWSATRRLTMADFQGHPGPSDRLAALTSADIKSNAACRDFVFSATVTASFDPNTSWFQNPKLASEALLRHEQLHFDITEAYARLMRQKLAAFAAKADCNKLQPAFNNVTKAVYAAWDNEQNRYDQETGHGLNAVRQAAWEKQTQLKLEQLKAFAVQ